MLSARPVSQTSFLHGHITNHVINCDGLERSLFLWALSSMPHRQSSLMTAATQSVRFHHANASTSTLNFHPVGRKITCVSPFPAPFQVVPPSTTYNIPVVLLGRTTVLITSNRLVFCPLLCIPAVGTSVVPEPGRVILPLYHTVDIEGIYESSEEVAFLFVTRSFNLRHAVFAEVYFRACSAVTYNVQT